MKRKTQSPIKSLRKTRVLFFLIKSLFDKDSCQISAANSLVKIIMLKIKIFYAEDF